MFAAILSLCGAMMTLTACHDDAVKSNIVTEAEMREAALGVHLDLSDVLLGGNMVRVWDLHDDDTFVAYNLYMDENDEFAVDNYTGRWKPFTNANVDWDIDETVQLHGISVVYDWISGIPGDESGAQK